MMEELKKPAVALPMDADGHSIPLDTKVLYSGPDKVKVLSFSYYPVADYWTVDYYRSDFCGKRCLSTELRLSPSDSWKQWEEDAMLGAALYCNRRFGEGKAAELGFGTRGEMVRDLMARAKRLAGVCDE